jgi:hypothetical protein
VVGWRNDEFEIAGLSVRAFVSSVNLAEESQPQPGVRVRPFQGPACRVRTGAAWVPSAVPGAAIRRSSPPLSGRYSLSPRSCSGSSSLPKLRVAGSNPVSRSNFFKHLRDIDGATSLGWEHSREHYYRLALRRG